MRIKNEYSLRGKILKILITSRVIVDKWMARISNFLRSIVFAVEVESVQVGKRETNNNQ